MAASIWTPDEIANYPTLTKYTSPVKRSERAILGRDREMQSVFASMNRAELCNVILLASAGTGKALANGTMIPVADSRGYVPIENLEIGDSVYDEHGIPVKVLGVFPQGELDAYKVDFSDGTYTICNDEHIWHVRSVWKHKENGDYQNLTLLQIVKSGIRKRTIKKSSGKESYHTCWYVPVAKAVVRDTVDLPLDPYVLGAMLGDGSLSSPISDNFILSSNDEFVVQKVASLIGSSGYVKSKYNYDWKFLRTDKKFYNNRECKYIQLYEICQDSSLSGLYHCKSIHRYIPEQYFFGSIDQRLALLQGLMDTDGCITGGFRANCSFCTNSRRLAVDVQRLTAGLGFRTRLKSYVRNDDYHKNKEYEIHFSVSNEDKFRLFTSPRHLNKLKDCILERNCKNNKRFDDLGIKAVTKLEEKQEMTCIYVDSESHCFQCGYNHIVTHNTALVQGCMMRDVSRRYLEVALSQMISENGTDALPGYLEALFTDVQRYGKQEKKEIVLFIDEFHRIVQASPAAVEAMKPLLADSGTRGIKVIAATTYDEFQQYVAPNQPLVERLQRINVLEPDQNTVVQILKGMAERYHVSHLFYGDSLFKAIYEYSQRYIPANAQPRKSILLMDSMIGWHRATGRKMDMKLLADVIYEQEGINVAFRVDATKIKEELDKRVLSQEFATSVIEDRLQLCVADLNDHSKPMSSFVFCGSTGVGKGHPIGTLIPTLEERDISGYTRVENIQVGDHVFAPDGSPIEVLGVFPRGELDVYKVDFSDKRSVIVDGDHLWGVYPYTQDRDVDNLTVIATRRLQRMLSDKKDKISRKRFSVPMNQPVQWPERNLPVDPYVMGVFIADGCLTKSVNVLTISSNDEFVVAKCAERIGAAGYKRNTIKHGHGNGQVSVNYNWYFIDPNRSYKNKSRDALIQKNVIFGGIEGVVDTKSIHRRIPKEYLHASVEQRWELVHGLFDTDGSISKSDNGRFNVYYFTSCEGLAQDVYELLYSLGVICTITSHKRDNGTGSTSREYTVHVRSQHWEKYRFFTLPRYLEIAEKAAETYHNKTFDTDYVDIVDITKLDEKMQTVCLYVDHPDHLYQSEKFVVTHNTEICKQMANILFETDRSLIRFDMTEYTSPESAERFRTELTARVWARPFCLILLDEIEKACREVTLLLLQVLDDGRLIDQHNREVVFTNAYIVLTTNAGSEIYKTIAQYAVDNTGSGQSMSAYQKLIRRSLTATTGTRFPPELLGRVDCIVPFQPLSEDTMKKIVNMKLNKLIQRVLRKHGIRLYVDENVTKYLVEDRMDTDSDAGGARAVMSKLEAEVTTALSRFINMYPDIKNVVVKVEGRMASEHKDMLKSEAKIVVKAVRPR